MVRLLVSNVSSVSTADIIIIGLPDESKSDSKRTGTNKGPDMIRYIYNDSLYFDASGKKIPILPMTGTMEKQIFDFGNISRGELYSLVFKITSLKKIPFILGGDHSLTTIALKAIRDSLNERISLFYFDAHPDFVTSVRDFHGSVISDSAESIDFQSSMLLGTRAAEPEEFDNMMKNSLEYLTPLGIVEKGLTTVAGRILSKSREKAIAYLSIDLDCIDSGIAPGVSVPAPAGLMPLDLIFLIKKICSTLHVVGLDIVELSPDYDLNDNTANIAARILMEAIASISLPAKPKTMKSN